MFALRQNKPYAPPSRWSYRLSRFMLSRIWWVMSRLVLPVLLIGFICYQIYTSNSVREMVSNTNRALFESYAYLPLFVIDEIQFENATKLREEEVRSMIDVELGQSIFEIDRAELLENLSNLDAVGKARVNYAYTGLLTIVLEPRVPVMILLENGQYSTIDDVGHRVERLNARQDRANLFVITGMGAEKAVPEAKMLIDALAPIGSRIRGLKRVGERRWDIVLANDAVIKLPAKNPILAVQTLFKRHIESDLLNRNFDVYDLRDPSRPILTLSPSVREQIRSFNESTTDKRT